MSQTVPTPAGFVPGARVNSKKSKTYTGMATQIQALSDLLPYYQQALAGAQTSQAGTDYNLFSQYAPQYNDIGQALAASNAQAGAESDLNILNGTGRDITQAALENAQIADPEYYNTRKLTADKLAELMSSINLGSDLSGGETSAIERALNQEGMRRGTNNAPSALDTVRNATRYGSAARNRELENQNQLTKAISAATSFIPTSKSGVDTFKLATGKDSSASNPFAQAALGAGNTGTSNGSNLFSGTNSTWQTRAQIGAANQSFGNILGNSFASSLGSSAGNSLGSGLMNMVGLCWVAREVYGVDNPKWLQFRKWLITKAPISFFGWYATKGERFAKYISTRPLHKFFVRSIFNAILKYN